MFHLMEQGVKCQDDSQGEMWKGLEVVAGELVDFTPPHHAFSMVQKYQNWSRVKKMHKERCGSSWSRIQATPFQTQVLVWNPNPSSYTLPTGENNWNSLTAFCHKPTKLSWLLTHVGGLT